MSEKLNSDKSDTNHLAGLNSYGPNDREKSYLAVGFV